MFHFPNHTLKLKAPDQPQSAGEGSLLTLCSTWATLCKFFLKIESNYWFSKTYPEIENMRPIKSSKQKLVLSRDSKNYLSNVSWKILIKIERTWRREIKEQAPQLTLLYHCRTVRSSHRRCCIRKQFLKILKYPHF